MTDRLYISEIFCSIQGEGMLTGVPSVFVRTSGCNLRCRFCDTPHTSWHAEGQSTALEEVLRAIEAHRTARHAVLTGGEPMIAKNMEKLAWELDRRGYHITVETAGTAVRDMPVSLYSISPKLANSTPVAGPWRARHDERRIDVEVIRELMRRAPYQLKFVVAEPGDLAEVDQLVERTGAARERVLLMPEGVHTERLDQVASWLVGECTARGYRFCDRLHVRLFGNTRGT